MLFLSIRPQAWRHWVLRPLRARRVDCSPGHSVRWDRDLGVVLAERAVAGHEHVLQLGGGINENELCLLKAFLGQLGICWAQRVRVPLEESIDWTYQYQQGCANEMHATTASPRRMLTCAIMMVILASILLELTTNEVGVSDAHTYPPAWFATDTHETSAIPPAFQTRRCSFGTGGRSVPLKPCGYL